MSSCKLPHIRPAGDELQLQLLGRVSNESFVRIAASTAEAVVEVGDCQLPAVRLAQASQQVEQDHRVHPARNGHKDFLTVPQEPPFGDGFPDLLPEFAH